MKRSGWFWETGRCQQQATQDTVDSASFKLLSRLLLLLLMFEGGDDEYNVWHKQYNSKIRNATKFATFFYWGAICSMLEKQCPTSDLALACRADVLEIFHVLGYWNAESTWSRWWSLNCYDVTIKYHSGDQYEVFLSNNQVSPLPTHAGGVWAPNFSWQCIQGAKPPKGTNQ